MRKFILTLALALIPALALAQVTSDVGSGYTFLKDAQGRVIYGWGVPPSSYEPLPTGTPFWNTSTHQMYYWSGTAWTAGVAAAAGASIEFEGTTVDAYETTLTATDPTADNTVTLPNASGTVVVSTLSTNAPSAANSVWAVSNRLDFEGATADDYEAEITAVDPTADRLFTLPNATGTAVISTLATNAPDAADAIWLESNSLVFEGATGGADTFETNITVVDPTADNTFTLPNASGVPVISTLATNAPDAANAVWHTSNNIVFEGATGGADAFETSITVVDPTADVTFTLPNYSGVPLLSTLATNAPDVADSIWTVQNALYFEGTTANDFEAVISPTDPTADRSFTLPDFGGTLLVSSTANEPDTANSFWVNTGELKFEGSTANAFETTVGVVDPTVGRTINLPNSSGQVVLANGTYINGSFSFVDETAKDLALISIANDSHAVGSGHYAATVANGTNDQAVSGIFTFACVNQEDTEACDLDMQAAESTIADAGTLACVPAFDVDESNAVMLKITCDQETGDSGGTVYLRLELFTSNTITLQ